MEQSKSKRGRSRETRANNNARSHEKDPTTPSKTKRASLTSSSKSKDKMLRSKSSSKASPLVGKKRTMLKARSTPDIQLITPSGSSKRKESKKRSGSENATLLTKKKSSKKAGSFRPYNIPIMHQLSSTPIPKPASTLHQALSRISVASFMEKNGNGLHGIPVMKVSHNHPGQQHRRILTLSADHCSLLLTHGGFLRKSKSKTIDVADVLDWHQGVVATKPLEEYCKSLQHQNDKKKNGENRGSVAGCIPFIVTIIYRNATTGRRDSLDLLVENQDFRRALVATLALLKKTYMEVTPLIGNETLLMRYLWKDIDSNNDNKVNEREFLTLCHRHHFYARDDAAKQFRLFCKDHQVKRNELSYRDCMRLLQMLKGRTPAMDAWKAVFGTASTVSAPALLESFLHGPQKESKTCDLQDAVDLIATMNATELDNHDTNGSASSNTKKLTRPQFEEFLRSSLNDCYDPVKRLPTRPLTKPISHYWINASYNTYLMGGEKDPSSGLSSSSIEAYTRALARGCKYIELDCWDGPILADGEYEPMVYHQNPRAGQRGSKKDNKTNVGEDGDECLHHDSTKISFRSVVSVIANFLKANPTSYPIILGLENHCSHPYQKAMAKLMKSAFGSKLFVPTSVHRTKELPSPEELVGHVVVKGKKSQSLNDSTEPGSRMKSVSGSDPYSSLFKMFDAPIKPESKLIQTYLPDQTILASPLQGKKKRKGGVGLGAGPGLFDKREDGDGMPKYTDELLSLTLFFDAEFSGFFEESMDFLPSHNHSLCSSRVAKVAAKYETNPKLWREFNQTHLTRIYPGGNSNKRTASKDASSASANPVLAWAMGCQLVALDVSSHDTNLCLNDGRFRESGGIGYVEKPASLLGGKPPAPRRLKIRIVSGSCLPKPIVVEEDSSTADRSGTGTDTDGSSSTGMDPMVILELHDVQVSLREQVRFVTTAHQVKCINENGFCPIFQDKGREFVVENSDVAMVVFRVVDRHIESPERNKIADASIPVSCLRRGYRSVQLFDEDNTRQGPYLFATLLVYIQYS